MLKSYRTILKIINKTYEEYRGDIIKNIKDLPDNWRKGQKVFNYIESKYKIARKVQFDYGVDCFYRDDLIDKFIETSYKLL